MNKIIINPHYCSREEHRELKDYLESESWDYSELKYDPDNVKTLKASLEKLIDAAEDLIQKMPQKGDKTEDCQRMTLQQAINEFSYAVNGIEQEDLIFEDNEK